MNATPPNGLTVRELTLLTPYEVIIVDDQTVYQSDSQLTK